MDANNVINVEMQIIHGILGKSVNWMCIFFGQQRCTSSWAWLSSENTKQLQRSDNLHKEQSTSLVDRHVRAYALPAAVTKIINIKCE
jgi:hypothetical protein